MTHALATVMRNLLAIVVLFAPHFTELATELRADPPRFKDFAPANRDGQPLPANTHVQLPLNPPPPKNALPLPPTKHYRTEEKKTHPITVTGRALDEAGKPIAGARIYIGAPLLLMDSVLLAETATNADGQYQLDQVRLPVLGGDDKWQPSHGRFRIMGQADGYGISWRGQKDYYDKFDPPPHGRGSFGVLKRNADGLGNLNSPDEYRMFDPIALDLMFLNAATLRGRVVDEHGAPVAGSEVSLDWCQQLNPKLFEQAKAGHGNKLEFYGFNILPENIILRKTNANGEFEFTSLPARCLFNLRVMHPDFAGKFLYAATTKGPLPDFNKVKIHTGDLVITQSRLLNVPVQVLYSDVEKPASKVLVVANAIDNSHYSDATTDAKGLAMLKLLPGKHRLRLYPAMGTQYVSSELPDPLIVRSPESRKDEVPPQNAPADAAVPSKPHIARLQRGCVVEVTIVDDHTGAGVPGVDLWSSPSNQDDTRANHRRIVLLSWETGTQTTHEVLPKTDAHGRMRFLFEPGNHRFGTPFEYRHAKYSQSPAAQTHDCRPGETLSFTFRLKP